MGTLDEKGPNVTAVKVGCYSQLTHSWTLLLTSAERPRWGRAAPAAARLLPALCRPRVLCPRALSSLESTAVHTVSPRSRPIAREAGAAAELGDGSGREDIRHDAESVQYWVVCGIWQHVNTYQVPYTHWIHEVCINTISFNRWANKKG